MFMLGNITADERAKAKRTLLAHGVDSDSEDYIASAVQTKRMNGRLTPSRMTQARIGVMYNKNNK